MGVQTDKIQQLEDELKKIDKTLTYYGKLLTADGDIDSDEQKSLATMQTLVKKAEAKFAKIKAKKKKYSNHDNKFRSLEEFEKALSKVEFEVQQLLSQTDLTS